VNGRPPPQNVVCSEEFGLESHYHNEFFTLVTSPPLDEDKLFIPIVSLVNFTRMMRSLIDAIKAADAGNKDEALAQCLLTMSQLSGSEVATPRATAILMTQFASTAKGIRTMEDCHYRDVPPIPFRPVDLSSPSSAAISVPPPSIAAPPPPIKAPTKAEKQIEQPQSRLAAYARRPSGRASGDPPPQFQTPLNAMGLSKKDKQTDSPAASLENDERLKNIDKQMIEIIENEVLMSTTNTKWEDVAGLEEAKLSVQEAAIYPMIYPELFTDLREPPRGVLFFGPPGTGKTMIAKALATEARCTFFNITAASLTSKWVGEGEKLTRALFAVARVKAPSIVFIDEIDSLLTRRSESDFEASRRVKTEFLLQFDGVASGNERLLVLGATNRPQDIDEAARRRFTRRIYIPLPDPLPRRALLALLLRRAPHTLAEDQIDEIVRLTDGYSCADIHSMCREAAMIPIRKLKLSTDATNRPVVRPMNFDDFKKALKSVRPSVSPESIQQYLDWNREFGYSSV
jgi:ATP-dependent 26S proteasome regulatory subunit